jgi:hypothetical protein
VEADDQVSFKKTAETTGCSRDSLNFPESVHRGTSITECGGVALGGTMLWSATKEGRPASVQIGGGRLGDVAARATRNR